MEEGTASEEPPPQSSPQSPTQAPTQAPPQSPSAPLPPWYPSWRGRPVYYGKPEALAWALDGVGRAIAFIAAGAFLSTALLRIATEEAGCETDPPPGETEVPECHGTVYGIRPSSLLTTYTAVVGIASAAILPLMGAVVDLTPHRLRVGRITTFAFVALLLPQAFISDRTWLAVAVLQIFVSFFGWAQSAISYAYLPEITHDEVVLNDLTSNFTITTFASMIAFLAFVISLVAALGLGDDDMATARMGMSIAFALSAGLLALSWCCLFEPRPALHAATEEKSVLTAGFVQLYQTSKRIAHNYRALKWFYISVAFSDSGLQALATIAVTYFADQLNFTGSQNGIAILCLLLGAIPGAFLSNWVTRRTDPRMCSIASLVLVLIVTTLVALLLTGPGQQTRAYILAFAWGTSTGMKWTCERLAVSSIIPEGQDAELMGTYLFAGQSLSWVPPLAFTAINESGISQRFGIASLNVYFMLALLCLLFMGSYANARLEAGREESAFVSTTAPKRSNSTDVTAMSVTGAEQPPI